MANVKEFLAERGWTWNLGQVVALLDAASTLWRSGSELAVLREAREHLDVEIERLEAEASEAAETLRPSRFLTGPVTDGERAAARAVLDAIPDLEVRQGGFGKGKRTFTSKARRHQGNDGAHSRKGGASGWMPKTCKECGEEKLSPAFRGGLDVCTKCQRHEAMMAGQKENVRRGKEAGRPRKDAAPKVVELRKKYGGPPSGESKAEPGSAASGSRLVGHRWTMTLDEYEAQRRGKTRELYAGIAQELRKTGHASVTLLSPTGMVVETVERVEILGKE